MDNTTSIKSPMINRTISQFHLCHTRDFFISETFALN